MRDLTHEEILSQLQALDLHPRDAIDLDEITNRVNAINQAISGLEDPDADLMEPAFVFWLTEENDEPR